jgi:uncharacterized protein DUF1573
MKFLFILLFSFFSATITGQSNIKFENDTINVGIICVEVDSIGHEIPEYLKLNFPFTNAGNEPLILSNSTGNGNGIADFPKDPVLPGQKGTIRTVIYRYRYTAYLKKGEELRPFVTCIQITGNFPEEQRSVCVKGYVKKEKKK